MFMAQTALKNGNTAAAENFAQKAVRILSPGKETGAPPLQSGATPPGPPSEKSRMPPLGAAEANPPEKPAPQPALQTPEQVKHTYKDVSNDAGVSFTYPSTLTGPQSFLAVPAHEAEHVGRRVSEAALKGERILVTVSYRVRYDPRTGQPYIAGGTTRTVKISDPGSRVDLFA